MTVLSVTHDIVPTPESHSDFLFIIFYPCPAISISAKPNQHFPFLRIKKEALFRLLFEFNNIIVV